MAHAATLRIQSATGSPGSIVFLPLQYEKPIGFPATIFCTIQYDPAKLRLLGVNGAAQSFAANKTVSFREPTPGEVRIVVGGNNRNFFTQGTVANLVFVVGEELEALKSGGLGPVVVQMTDLSIAGANAEALSVSPVSGVIVVEASSNLPLHRSVVVAVFVLLLALLLLRHRAGKKIGLVALTLIVPTVVYAALLAGDVDNNGLVDEADLTAIRAAYLNNVYAIRADLDMSGEVDAIDYQWMVLLLLGWDLDPDNDGLITAAEENLGLNPNLADSDGDGVDDFQEILDGTDPGAPPSFQSGLMINEFVASNSRGLRDRDSDEEDWIEIYNAGPDTVSLLGWSLTDNANNPRKWWFPDLEMAPDTFLIVFASNKSSSPGELHASFALSKGGEYLALVDPEGVAVSEFAPQFPPQATDISYGRYGSGPAWRYFTTPTPGAHNVILEGAYEDFVEELFVTPERGFFAGGVTVTASTPHPAGEIWYTTDGRIPEEGAATLYSGPITVNDTSTLRFRAFAPQAAPSATLTHTYFVDLPANQVTLPIVSIVADPAKELYEPDGIMSIMGGVYVNVGAVDPNSPFAAVNIWTPTSPDDINNAIKRGSASERPTSAEFMYPDNQLNAAQIDAAIRVHGSDFHRRQYLREPGVDWRQPSGEPFFGMFAPYNKFSFQLRFKRDFGPQKFRHDVFGTGDRYDALILRGGHNDGYNPFIIDELIRRLFGATGQISSRGKLVNLFILGEHKGYYNLVERLDEDFFSLRTGSDEAWDVLTHGSSPDSWDVRDGDDAAFVALINFVLQNDLALPANYQWVADRLDIVNFCDFLLVQIYSGNVDWVGNNWTIARERTPGSKFTYHVWDAEESMRPVVVDKTALIPFTLIEGIPDQGLETVNSPIAYLYRALRGNADFRALLAARAQLHLGPGGVLSPAGVQAVYGPLRDEMLTVRPDLFDDIESIWIPQRTQVVLDALDAVGIL